MKSLGYSVTPWAWLVAKIFILPVPLSKLALTLKSVDMIEVFSSIRSTGIMFCRVRMWDSCFKVAKLNSKKWSASCPNFWMTVNSITQMLMPSLLEMVTLIFLESDWDVCLPEVWDKADRAGELALEELLWADLEDDLEFGRLRSISDSLLFLKILSLRVRNLKSSGVDWKGPRIKSLCAETMSRLSGDETFERVELFLAQKSHSPI